MQQAAVYKTDRQAATCDQVAVPLSLDNQCHTSIDLQITYMLFCIDAAPQPTAYSVQPALLSTCLAAGCTS